MAVVPTLAAMAALTLFQHPEAQPEDVSVDYSPFSAPATAVQRAWRSLIRFRRALGLARLRMYYRHHYGPGYTENINTTALNLTRRRYRFRPRFS